jgi:hypothetical protein
MKCGRETLKGALAIAAIALNVLVVFAIMTPFSLLKLAVPALPSRRFFERALTAVASQWVAVNATKPDRLQTVPVPQHLVSPRWPGSLVPVPFHAVPTDRCANAK